ncbi:hypothetical protein Pyn_22869 [Prunus yedoensis var. nudiflora]|uniref:Late embryogenesis abundant protein LEA-2 subgroup domain-containing protein n=1 Tax=Prunus yedoensis var. nudiflora TaxID=2094558 RepID=A0A314XRK6_PRUYE|nr:hypothetical protein Pyn_22869 [Prunus yedoensis var. nudiflora]
MFATESSDVKNTTHRCKKICIGLLSLLFIAGAYTIFFIHMRGYTDPKFSVNGAYLNRFNNYTEINHNLPYNLVLNITLTNPNKKVDFEWSDTQVIAYYQNERFGVVTLIDRWKSIHQDPKNTTIFQNVLIQGWKPLLFEEHVLPNVTHHYRIDLVIAFHDKIHQSFAEVTCNLTVPLNFNVTSCDGFNTTKCSYIQFKLEHNLAPKN